MRLQKQRPNLKRYTIADRNKNRLLVIGVEQKPPGLEWLGLSFCEERINCQWSSYPSKAGVSLAVFNRGGMER